MFAKKHLFVPTKEKADVLSGAHTVRNAARTNASNRQALTMSAIFSRLFKCYVTCMTKDSDIHMVQ